jgi:hypothetical protein
MEIVVDKEKILMYLLKPRNRNDKSKFLNKLGFYEYGTIFNVFGTLKGLNESSLFVKTIWINLFSSHEIKLVTLFPERT